MQVEALAYLACPECALPSLELISRKQVEGDILEGQLICRACYRQYNIIEGIPSLCDLEPLASQEEGLTICSEPQLIQGAEMQFRDEHAEIYDTLPAPETVIEINTTLSELQAQPGDTLLDMGCGTGRALLPLIDNVKCIVGVDFSLASLKHLRAKLNPHTFTRVHLVHADVTRLPVQSDKFNRTTCVQLLQSFPSIDNRLSVLRHAHRATKAGGRFVLSVFHYSQLKRLRSLFFADPTLDIYEREGLHHGTLYYHNYTVRELHNLLRQVGFTPLHHYGVNTPLTRRFGMAGVRIEKALLRTSLAMPFAHWVIVSAIRSQT